MVQLGYASVLLALWISTVLAHPRLFSRQSDDPFSYDPSIIPSACTSQCSALTDIYTSNPKCDDDINCVCSATLANAVPGCFKCLYSTDSSTFPNPDKVVSALQELCSAASIINSATVTSTASGSGSSATQPASGSGTASGKGTSTSTVSSASATSSPNGSGSTAQNMFAVVGAVAVGAAALL